MPTFNQLVRKGRQTAVKEIPPPRLLKGYNFFKKKRPTPLPPPEERCVYSS